MFLKFLASKPYVLILCSYREKKEESQKMYIKGKFWLIGSPVPIEWEIFKDHVDPDTRI